MTHFKKIVATVLGTCTLAGNMMAQELGGTKQAPLQSMLPNAYGELLTRHYLTGEGESQTAMAQVRYTLGSTWFDGALDTRVVFGLNKKTGDNVVEDRGTRLEAEYALYSDDILNLTPYTEVAGPKNAKDQKTGEVKSYGTSARVGFLTELAYETPTPVGNFTWGTSFDAYGFLGSRPSPDQISVTENGKPVQLSSLNNDLALLNTGSDKEEMKVSKKESQVINDFAYSVTYEPNMVRGLTFLARTYHRNTFEPVMELNRETGSVDVRKEGRFNQTVYTRAYQRMHRLSAAYDLSDSLSVSNDFWLKNRDANDRQLFENVVSLNAALF